MRLLACLSLLAGLAICVLAEPAKEAVMVTPQADKVQTGEFWYRLEDDAGKAVGYSLLTVDYKKTLQLRWEMKMTLDSGAYEEARTMDLNAEQRLLRASYVCNDQSATQGAREGKAMKGTGGAGAFETAVADDALSGLAFVLVAGLPREVGAKWTFTEVDEASNFANLGQSTITCLISETLKIEGKDVKVWRYDLKRTKAKTTVTIWADESGRIAKVQWGPKLFQVISSTATKDLYTFVPDAFMETPGAKGQLVMKGDFEKSSQLLYDWFTEDELLKKWWPQRTEIELKVGGKYHLFWDEPKWTLRGEVKACDPGKKFTFTWKWDDAPEPDRTVELTFAERAGGGCTVTINHGPYGETKEEQEARSSVKQGWVFFGNKLRTELGK